MDYDPLSSSSRVALAAHLLDRLAAWGFKEIPNCGERVFDLAHGQNVVIRVYTTIEGSATRPVAKDAIRVSLVYTGAVGRGLGKERRVNRVGVIEEIADRMKARIDSMAAQELPRCERCGDPKFRSGKGNMVCAALCWKSIDEMPRQQLREAVAETIAAVEPKAEPARPRLALVIPSKRPAARRRLPTRAQDW